MNDSGQKDVPNRRAAVTESVEDRGADANDQTDANHQTDANDQAAATTVAKAADRAELAAVPTAEAGYTARISSDRLTVTVDGPDPTDDVAAAALRIRESLGPLGLPQLPAPEALAARLRSECQVGADLLGFVVLTGSTPVPPRDGRCEWTEEFFATGFAVDPRTGAFDYWDRVDRRAVVQGQVLARIFSAKPGRDGVDVLGHPIKVREPKRENLRAGAGVAVETNEDVGVYRAAVAGRLRYQDGTVCVDPVYVVRGNVSLESGNIVHTGALVVEGDVETGATLDVDGEIVVRGTLEPCTIRGGGDLVVGGGIIGNEEHRIDVAGRVQARYIREAHIDCRGDIEVSNEIDHAHIRTRGKVVAPAGRLTGGVTVALRGIRVARAGAEGTKRTELIAGVDPFLEEETAPLVLRLAKLTIDRAASRSALARAESSSRTSGSAARAALAPARERLDRIQKVMDRTSGALHERRRRAQAAAVPRIVILKEIHAGCVLQLETVRTRLPVTSRKPRLIVQRRGRIRLLPLGDDNLPEEP